MNELRDAIGFADFGDAPCAFDIHIVIVEISYSNSATPVGKSWEMRMKAVDTHFVL